MRSPRRTTKATTRGGAVTFTSPRPACGERSKFATAISGGGTLGWWRSRDLRLRRLPLTRSLRCATASTSPRKRGEVRTFVVLSDADDQKGRRWVVLLRRESRESEIAVVRAASRRLCPFQMDASRCIGVEIEPANVRQDFLIAMASR